MCSLDPQSRCVEQGCSHWNFQYPLGKRSPDPYEQVTPVAESGPCVPYCKPIKTVANEPSTLCDGSGMDVVTTTGDFLRCDW